ncbi:MAG: SpoIIE family protein phosphatase [Proteobacteria bacterium]|nr:SpoIIE family protein phosphatase [Pseudomonadota bacterium]
MDSDTRLARISGATPRVGPKALAVPDLRRLRVSIRSKLILLSTLLLAAAISLFGAVNAHQTRLNIDRYSERLRRTITEALHQAGRAQLSLLGTAARIAIVQSDYGSLTTMVADVQRQDARITHVSIRGPDQRVLAEVGGALPSPLLATLAGLKGPTTHSALPVGGQRSMVFVTPITYKDRAEPLGSVVIAFTLRSLEAELAKAEETKSQVAAANLRNIILVGLVAVLMGTLLTIVQGMRISRPIRALATQAKHIADGDFSGRVQIPGHDEIGQLGDMINHMSGQIVTLMQGAQQKAALEREFEIANSIQNSLVPQADTVALRGIELAGFFRSASQCGGDWWGYYDLGRQQSLLVIGDVTGHGVPAAMITALVKGAASTMVSVADGRFDLQAFMQRLNAVVYEAGGRQFFMTFFAALYDAERHEIAFANAGHTSPYVVAAQGGELTPLLARGTWLGYYPTQEFELNHAPVKRGDLIVCYTDGIVELENAKGAVYGDSRFRRLVKKHARLPLSSLKEQIVGDVYGFADGEPQQDDITLLVARITT